MVFDLKRASGTFSISSGLALFYLDLSLTPHPSFGLNEDEYIHSYDRKRSVFYVAFSNKQA